mmetsp:Transcript_6525/g.10363  ORF Transcript_6525/g.10363 Transcript_6525/m.10363 type:complete len:374 (-) Transcript_6525:19-1140(-)
MGLFGEKNRIRKTISLSTFRLVLRLVIIPLFFLSFLGLYISYTRITPQFNFESTDESQFGLHQLMKSREYSLLPISNYEGQDGKSKTDEQGNKNMPQNLVPSASTVHLANSGHSHLIPNNLIFTHYIDLLHAKNVTGEDIALQNNVRNNIALHPESEVHFLTDEDCLISIARVMGPESPLIDFFKTETEGMYKADICRGAALYELGGLYMDVDLQSRMNVRDIILPTTTFVVPIVHQASKHPGSFFQAFIGSIRQNPILFRYLELFIEYYEGRINLQGPLGVLLLRRAHDQIIGTHNNPKSHAQSLQYFQEVKHDAGLFPDVPPPTWGSRRACRFVVVANYRTPFIVPFYSRVKGSRMCGGADSEPKHKDKKI